MKWFRIMVIGCVIGAWVVCGAPEEELTTGEKAKKGKALMALALKASGGEEANRKIWSRRIEGTFSMNDQGPWDLVSTEKAPNDKFVQIVVSDYGSVTEGCDGTIAWKQEPGAPARSLQGPEAAEKLRDARFYRGTELMSTYKTAVFAGQVRKGGVLYNEVHLTYADDPDMVYFLNAHSHVVERMTIAHPTAGAIELEFNDNKMIESGVLFPFEMIIKIGKGNAQTIMTMRFSKVTTNIDVDDAIFDKPAGKPAETLAVP